MGWLKNIFNAAAGMPAQAELSELPAPIGVAKPLSMRNPQTGTPIPLSRPQAPAAPQIAAPPADIPLSVEHKFTVRAPLTYKRAQN